MSSVFMPVGCCGKGFFTGYTHHPERYYVLEKPIVYLFLTFSYGHQAVMLFFVLSGFVIHLRYSLQLNADPKTSQFNLKAYLGRRAKRIYPPLIFAMLLTFFIDRAGMAANYPIYSTPTVLNLTLQPNHELSTGLGNLTFLMTVYVPPFGMNGVLWSLKDEWWFYMLYPLFWWLSKRSIGLATGIVAILFILSFFTALWPIILLQGIFSVMLAWWFGVLLADIYSGRISIPFWKIAPLTLLFIPLIPLFVVMSAPTSNTQIVLDIGWALAFSGLLAALFSWRGDRIRNLLAWFKPLGNMSYTLYLIHFPILVFLSGWLMSTTPDQTLPVHVSWVFVGILVCVCIAYVAHYITEKPFAQNMSQPSIGRVITSNPRPLAAGRDESVQDATHQI